MSQPPYPFLFRPVYKPYPWGGDRFARLLGRALPPDPCAESWEIADRPEGMSILTNGPLAGRTLRDLVRELGPALLGDASRAERFPLLVKLIDARERTSLQVHPDEEGARRVGGEAKAEFWYALEGTRDARVFAGLAPGINRAAFEVALAERRLEPALREIPIRAGEAVSIPGGRMHAIDAGCFLYEVQQSSDTTLRFYDWGRNDPDRPLHIAESLKVVDTGSHGYHKIRPVALAPVAGVARSIRVATSYFVLVEYSFAASAEIALADVGSFSGLTCLDGAIRIAAEAEKSILTKGRSTLLPASLGSLRIGAEAGSRCIVSWIPDLKRDVVDPLKKLGVDRDTIVQLSGNPCRGDLLRLM